MRNANLDSASTPHNGIDIENSFLPLIFPIKKQIGEFRQGGRGHFWNAAVNLELTLMISKNIAKIAK